MNHDIKVSQDIIKHAKSWLQDLIRIDSTNPPGNEQEVVSYVSAELKKFAIDSELVAGSDSRTNLMAGSSSPALVLSAHADTVPVLDAGAWSHEPFSAAIADGCIWGRGALDMKFKIAFDLALMKWAKENELADLVMQVVVADEETGSKLGAKYLCKERASRFVGAHVINEVGGFPIQIAGRQLLLIQSGEKGHFVFRLSIKGEAVHASIPRDSLRIERLISKLEDFRSGLEKFSLCKSAKLFLQGLQETLPAELSKLAAALQVSEGASTALSMLSQTDELIASQIRSLLFDTCTLTICKFGDVANILSNSGELIFDCRIIPGTSLDDFEASIRRNVAELESAIEATVELEVIESSPGYEIDVEDKVFKHCLNSLESKWGPRCGGAKAVPYLLPASSDSSHYSRAGLIPIGFSPLLFDPEFPGFALSHAVDERIPETAFEEGLVLYIKTMGEYLLGLK